MVLWVFGLLWSRGLGRVLRFKDILADFVKGIQ